MSASPYRVALLAAVIFALSPCAGRAQKAPGMPGDFFTENYNLQFFEPFDLDLDNAPVRGRVGFFFTMDKLYWNISGERVELGAPGATQTAEVVFPVTGNSQGTPPAPYQIPNGIQDATPNAEFGWGERYEFGYSDGDVGVLVSVLNGPSVNSTGIYGFGEGFPFGSFNSDTPGVDPFYTGPAIDGDGNGVGDGNGPTGDFRAYGFGSVPVTFNAPPGFFMGFRDYLINLAGATNGTNTGPIFAPLNVGSLQESLDDDDLDTDVLFIADDIDGDGNPGAFLVIGPGGEIIIATDFGDLHNFNVFFDQVNVRSVMETHGIELMRTFELDNNHQMRRNQNKQFTLAYGVRLLRLRDQFNFTGLGSILGQTTTNTEIDNQLIGPQVALNYTNQRGRWRFNVMGRAFAAYNIADVSQDNLFGGELVPGGMNRPLFGRPTATTYGEQKEEISPLVELRLNTQYSLTSGVSLNAGYTMMFIDNIHRGGLSTEWEAPVFGIADGKSDLIINGLNFGIEGRY